ncbi:MAG: glycosyltransferase family 9 protein [Acidobacteria bacterium]|nr:glycosyltransferase family 9 protein [Acidobacteriota bacterium]
MSINETAPQAHTSPADPPRRILVARLSAVGDVVRTIPAVRAVRHLFPDAEIHWLVEDRCAAVLEGLPDIRRLVLVPRRLFHRGSPPARAHALVRFLGELRATRYDLYLDFHGLLKSALYGWLAGIPRRVGYSAVLAREGSHRFYTETVAAVTARLSRYERNFLIPRHFDPSLTMERPGLPLTAAERDFARRFMAQAGLAPCGFFLLHPGTSPRGRYKQWPPERFAALADLLRESTGQPAVISWGPGEEELAETVRARCRTESMVMPPSSLRELSAVIGQARLCVANDSGPLHMASALGTPVVTVLGPSDPVINEPAPFTPFRVVYAGVDCSPCRKKRCRTLECLRAVSPEQVHAAALDLLAEVDKAGRKENPL